MGLPASKPDFSAINCLIWENTALTLSAAQLFADVVEPQCTF